MPRPKKQTVDYFPHYCSHKKTMFIIEQRFGNDGYAFWFKLLEMLGNSEGHYIDLRNDEDREFLSSLTRMEWDKCNEILCLLSKLGAIDKELWEEINVVWSDHFVDNIKEAYRNRIVDIPDKPTFLLDKSLSKGVSDVRNPQMKEDEMKEDEMKVDVPVNGSPAIQDIVNLFHEKCPSFPKLRTITAKRKKQIRARIKDYPDLEIYRELFDKAEKSNFLSGRNGKFTSCNFDWLLNENNMIKVLEGNYDNRASPGQQNVENALRLVEKYSTEKEAET